MKDWSDTRLTSEERRAREDMDALRREYNRVRAQYTEVAEKHERILAEQRRRETKRTQGDYLARVTRQNYGPQKGDHTAVRPVEDEASS